MSNLIRKLRGVISIGLTWGVVWAAIIATIGVVLWIADPSDFEPGESIAEVAAATGFIGLVSGMAFGALLAVTERRRTILDLSPGRAALLGIVGSAALPLLTGLSNDLMLIVCPLGAVFAAASVAIARRAELRDPEQSKLPHREAPAPHAPSPSLPRPR